MILSQVLAQSTEAADGSSGARSSQYFVRAVDRAMQLLEAVADEAGRGKTLSEVARRAAMPEPSTLRYLTTLEGRGYVEHVGTGEQGRYRLGLGVFMLAERALGNWDLRAIAMPYMQRLLDLYGETVNLAVFRQRKLVIIESLEGHRSIHQGARVGEQDLLRSTSLGKAVLALHSDEQALALLRDEEVKRSTPKTLLDDGAMLRELRTVRSRGYAIDDEESEIGLRCVGVAFRGRGDQKFGLSISGPSQLLTRDIVRKAGPVLCEVGRELTVRLNPSSDVNLAPTADGSE